MRPIFWGGLLIAMIGILIVLGQDFITHPMLGMGDMLSMFAGLWYGLFFLAAERSRDKLSSFTAWWVSSATSTVALLVICLVLGLPLFGYPIETYLNFFAIAIVVQVVSLLCVNYALGHLPASIVSPTLLGQPGRRPAGHSGRGELPERRQGPRHVAVPRLPRVAERGGRVSALAQVAQMRIAHSGESFGTLHRAVGDLAHEGRTREIRSKARLVAAVLDSPELFARYADGTFDTADEFLGAVAQRVAESLLTAR